MNWLLPAALLFVLFSTIDGHKKGFIKKSVGLVSLILTLAVASVTTPYIAAYLQEETALYDTLCRMLQSGQSDLYETLALIGLGEAAMDYVAQGLLRAAAFLITLILVGILVQGAAFSLGVAAKLPVLNGINKVAGLILGFAEGILWIWVFFFVITLLSATEWGGRLLLMVADSELLSWLYRENLLFVFLK